MNGKDGLRLIKVGCYDLVFTDHDMPEMTGVELVRQIREIDKDTKISIISGYPNMEEFVAKSIGADEYLGKPLNLDTLTEVLNRYSTDKKT